MAGPLQSTMFNGVTPFYNGVATQSLRRNDDDSAYLYRTPSSASNRKTFVFSCWYKRANLSGVNQPFFYAGSSGSDFTLFYIDGGSNKLSFYDYDGSTDYGYNLSIVLRDTSAWYHLVCAVDTTQGTDTNRVQIYVNGTLVSSDVGTSYGHLPENYDTRVNDAKPHWLGRYNANYIDGYMAETNFVDGLSFFSDTSGTANTSFNVNSFGETKNGVWIPIKYTGSYGTNGFRLQFDQTGVGTASTSTIGADTSGNTHHFTSSGIVASDCNMPDSPENNFATWSPLFTGGEQSANTTGVTLSEGNLQVSVPTNEFVGSTFRPTSGKWYAEIRVKTIGSANGEIDWGWIQATTYAGTTGHGAQANKWGGYYHAYSTDHIKVYDETSQLGSNINLTISAGDVLQLAWDIDNNKGWIGINDTYYAADNGTDGNPSAGTNQTFTFTDDEAQNLQVYIANGTGTDVHVVNFGQDSTFGGDETATTNADANGIGAFHHAPPTGFLACCSANLPEPTISPNADTQAVNYFGTLTYTGDGQSSQNIVSGATGIGGEIDFQPDWVWIKNRSSGYSHQLQDSNRGFVATKVLSTNQTAGEGVASATGDNYGHMSGVEANGFTVTHTINSNNDGGTIRKGTHFLNDTYVAWNWKANGGTTVTNEAGSIDSTVQANTTAGFSIVTWSGNETNSATIGHGLSSAPKIILTKCRSHATSWIFGIGQITGTVSDYLTLNNTNPKGNSSTFYQSYTSDSNTTFTVGVSSADEMNRNTGGTARTYVSYCFAEIEGYSKFGSFSGNSNADGAFVYTGFRPARVMIKNTNATSSGATWFIYDNVRDLVNVMTNELGATANTVEGSIDGNALMDFYSNGFKPRSNSYTNQASQIYMAFAEAPFKYANAR